jgi:hypothetical protein
MLDKLFLNDRLVTYIKRYILLVAMKNKDLQHFQNIKIYRGKLYFYRFAKIASTFFLLDISFLT